MKKSVLAALAGTVVSGALGIGLIAASGNYSAADYPQFNKVAVAETSKEETKPEVKLDGDKVDNLRTDANPGQDFCKKSKLPAGEGKADKGGTCLSVPIGEIAKNPVKVAITGIPEVLAEGKSLEVKVAIEDKFGPLDLNAFTFDESGKAGKSFLEAPGELDNDGRPLIHCHLGISTLKERGGLPGDKYDVVFTGVQGLKGDVKATVENIPNGIYRADVYCSQPGHLALPTAKADNVQAFDSVEFEVK